MSRDQYIQYLRSQGIRIGEGCDIHKNVYFGTEPFLIQIGKNSRITKGVQFITHDGGVWTLRRMGLIDDKSVKYGNIVVGDNCNISWDVTIMPNVRIGNNCVIAAGAVVTKDIPSNTIWGGIPAKQIETVEAYYTKIVSQCVPTYYMTMEEKKAYLQKYKPELFK